jgi:hypothetical protein
MQMTIKVRMTPKMKTTIQAFPYWCDEHGIDVEKLTDEQLVQFFLYFNSHCDEYRDKNTEYGR